MEKSVKDFNLEEVFKSNLKEEVEFDTSVINFEGVMKAINEDYTNPIIGGKKDELRIKAKEEATNEFIKGLGVEGVENIDSFNAYVKRLSSTTSEKDEALSRTEKEKQELQQLYEELNGKYEETNSKLTQFNRLTAITKAGFLPDKIEDVMAIAQAKVTEDKTFEQVIEEMKETHKYFMPQKGKSGSSLLNQNNDGEIDDEVAKWRKEAGL